MPLEILKFFAKNEQKDGKVIQKQVHHFCEYFSKKFATDNYPQPRVVSKICDILCDNQKLSLISKAGPDNINSSYWCSLNENVEKDSALEKFLEQHLAHIVFGFKFIYEDFKSRVLPIEYEDKADNLYLGTCFLYQHGIVTAKHCVEGAKGISIKGFSAEQLYSAKYETSPNPLLDLIFISFPNPLDGTLMLNSDAEILDEVMTLGYPKIAGYHNFLTAENAVISARYTASTGQVAANAEDIWMKEKLFLITAKIKGGNAGSDI